MSEWEQLAAFQHFFGSLITVCIEQQTNPRCDDCDEIDSVQSELQLRSRKKANRHFQCRLKPGRLQPKLLAEQGFYDLRVAETRRCSPGSMESKVFATGIADLHFTWMSTQTTSK